MSRYNQVTPEIIALLQAAAPGRVVVGEDVNPDYARDEMPIYGVRMPEVSIDATKLKDTWAARSSFLEGIEEQTKLLDECDVVVPVNKIAQYVAYVAAEGEQYDFQVKYFGHAGDGNLHIYTCSNDMEQAEFEKQVEQFFTSIYGKTVELGGQISGEHGIGLGKVKFLAEAVGPVNMALMQGIKNVFDPKGILNPGKVCHIL